MPTEHVSKYRTLQYKNRNSLRNSGGKRHEAATPSGARSPVPDRCYRVIVGTLRFSLPSRRL